jgi:hypothetical protein
MSKIQLEVRKNALVIEFVVQSPAFGEHPQGRFQKQKPGIYTLDLDIPLTEPFVHGRFRIIGTGSNTQPPAAVLLISIDGTHAGTTFASIGHGSSANSVDFHFPTGRTADPRTAIPNHHELVPVCRVIPENP